MNTEKQDFDPFKLSARQALALSAISCQDSYGLQVGRAIKQATDGRVNLEMGALYPILHILEDRGLVESYGGLENAGQRQEGRRKYYRLTEAGCRAWDEYRKAFSFPALKKQRAIA